MIGTIKHWPGSVAPTDHAFCDGTVLPINGNQDLFNVLGATYGGDGINTFGLPDLRSRIPKGAGQAPGLPLVPLGAFETSAAPGTSDVHTLGLNYIIKIQ